MWRYICCSLFFLKPLRENVKALPWQMLPVDDLVIITKSFEELDARYAASKHCKEGKGLRVNLAKTKVMIKDINRGPTFSSGKHPRGVC